MRHATTKQVAKVLCENLVSLNTRLKRYLLPLWRREYPQGLTNIEEPFCASISYKSGNGCLEVKSVDSEALNTSRLTKTYYMQSELLPCRV